MKSTKVSRLVFCALFTALIAVFAQIQLPVGLVPLSLCTFGIMMAGLLLGWRDGGLSVAVYILLGLVGVPVFAGFRGGVETVLGPTGGYIVGYLPCAMAAGLPLARMRDSFWGRCALLILGTVLCYALGTAWFIHITGRTLAESLSSCVLPFLPGDAAKIALASFLAPRLRKGIRVGSY